MAVRKTIIPIVTRTLKDAIGIHKDRETVDVKELIEAKIILMNTINKLQSNAAEIDEVLEKFTFAQIQTATGCVNPCIQVDGTTNVSFKEADVTISDIDASSIMSLGGLLPKKYIITKTELDKKLLVKEALEGTLDTLLLPYVSVHTERKLKLSQRAVKQKD